MYHSAVRRIARGAYRSLSRGDYEAVLRSFAPDAVLEFPGDHPLGGSFHGLDAIRDWFERLHASFPDLRFEPGVILVDGYPWNTVVAARFTVTATLPNGRAYANEGMQFLRLRWGRIVEDVLYEDTQALAEALAEALADRGLDYDPPAATKPG